MHNGIQVGSAVSILASVMYASYRSSGRTGFGRLLSFWTGLPLTLLVALVIPVRPARLARHAHHKSADDEGELLAEIRRDRAQRLIAQRRSPEASEHGVADNGTDPPV
ncbi:MAG: hypothetical protein BMS9Abin29_2149 [Gemmatimonadota bacterium]|nr:MAG: hypothetical protein BMS9Abin29_2149 [Gemmatimonadota bacterium]